MSARRLLELAALALLLLGGLQLRLPGIDAPSLHPDEPTIGRWLAVTAEHGEIRDRLYPGGFFALAMPVRKACLAVSRWRAAAAYRAGDTDRITVPWDDIRFARHLNLWLGLLTGLLAWSLARHVTGSRLAALAAAAFLLLNPVHVEHCHYAETDVVMLFGLALALLLWTRAIASGNATFLLAGAAAAGFAAGSKFTLGFLLVPLMIAPFLSRHVEQYRRPLGRTLALLGLSLLLFAAMFAWTNPAVLDPARFMESAARQAKGLADEMTVSLGGEGATAGALMLWRLRLLGRHALGLGPLFLALSAAGLLAALGMRRFRRHGLVLVVVPLLILAVHAFASPFIRKQEFMTYLPVLAVLAALPLSLFAAETRGIQFLARGAMVALAVAALGWSNLESRRVAGLFGWKDPRLEARNWLAVHGPPDRTAAVENNARAAAEGAFAGHVPLRHVADLHEGLSLLDRRPVDYLVRDTFAQGRGHTDPLTGETRPRHAAIAAAFAARSRLLMAWAPFTGPVNASHAGHGAALHAMADKPASPDYELTLRLLDPVFISDRGRETEYADESRVGGRQAVLLTEQPREMALGGPGPGATRLWVTLNTEEREADIRLRAWGRTRRVRLPPWSVRTVALDKPWWWRVPEPYAVVTAWSAPLKSLVSPPCWMRLGRRQAMDAGYTLGFAGDMLPLFLEPELAASLDLFRFSVRGGEAALAMEAQNEAAVAFETLNRALAETGKVIAVNGVLERDYDDFARIRDTGLDREPVILASDTLRKRDSGFVRALKESLLEKLGGDPARDAVSLSPYRPPFRLAAGRYRLDLAVRPGPSPLGDEAGAPQAGRYALVDARGVVLAEGDWADLPADRDTPLSVELTAGREETPEIHLVSAGPRVLTIRRAELRWTLRSRLEAAQADLAGCFEKLGRMEDEAPAGIRFAPFYRCTGARLDPEKGTVRISLQALLGGTPPHELQVVARRGRKWRQVAAAPIRQGLLEGETVAIILPLPDGSPLNAGLRIRTGILTQPGSLSVENSPETVIPLSQLLISK